MFAWKIWNGNQNDSLLWVNGDNKIRYDMLGDKLEWHVFSKIELWDKTSSTSTIISCTSYYILKSLFHNYILKFNKKCRKQQPSFGCEIC